MPDLPWSPGRDPREIMDESAAELIAKMGVPSVPPVPDGHEWTPDDDLVTFTLTVCTYCLNGAAGECHTPGCVFWICPAPDEEQADRLREAAAHDVACALIAEKGGDPDAH